MDESALQAVTARFQAALDSFIEKVRQDVNILAVIVMGSMAYDQVWEKSDMDITVLVREQKLETYEYCVDEDGIIINVHTTLKHNFCRMLERSKFNTMYARAVIAYTVDESLHEFLTEMQTMGERDIQLCFFSMACDLIGCMEKIEKWLKVKRDVRYAQYTLLKTADMLAYMELVRRGIKANRESVVTLLALDYDFIAPFYVRPMEAPMTEAEVYAALDALRGYLYEHGEYIAQPAREFMEDGDMKTVTMLVRHFGIGSHGIYHVFDFLTELGLVIKVTNPIRITPRGKQVVDEVGFMLTPSLPGMI